MNIYKAFESFQVPAYYSSFSSELMMYASGKTTGMAVSLGLLYIAPHSDDEVIKAKEYFQTIEQSYELPDGQIIQTDVKRFAAPEVLFKPHLMGMSDKISLLDSAILGGGCSLLPQLPERLQRELATLFPPTIRPNLVVPEERKYSVWLGGSILSSLSRVAGQKPPTGQKPPKDKMK
eukprot:gene11386-12409_t